MSFTVRFQDGDLEFGTAGEQVLITGSEKAAQDLLHEIFMPYDAQANRGNEMFAPNGLLTTITGSDLVGTSFVQSSIQAAVQRVMRVQANDGSLTDAERIRRIKSLIVRRLDATSVGFFLAVEVGDQTIALSRAIRTGHLGDPAFPVVGGSEP